MLRARKQFPSFRVLLYKKKKKSGVLIAGDNGGGGGGVIYFTDPTKAIKGKKTNEHESYIWLAFKGQRYLVLIWHEWYHIELLTLDFIPLLWQISLVMNEHIGTR